MPGTRRALEVEEAAALAPRHGTLRSAAGRERSPVIVGIFADRPAQRSGDIAQRVGLEAVQLSGREHPAFLAQIPLPVVKVLHLSDAPSGGDYHAEKVADAVVGARAATWRSPTCGSCCWTPPMRPCRVALAAGCRSTWRARSRSQVPVVLAGGLDPSTIAAALLDVPAIGVDVAGGVEPRPASPGRPPKDPFRVALFVKRARGARARPADRGLAPASRRPLASSSPTPAAAGASSASSAAGSCPRR